jgi:hypothetical protein
VWHVRACAVKAQPNKLAQLSRHYICEPQIIFVRLAVEFSRIVFYIGLVGDGSVP